MVNNLMLRYGITKSTEIRTLIDYGKEYNQKGFKPITLSVKQELWKQNKYLPATSFVGYLAYEKLASTQFKSNEMVFELKLAFENEISDRVSIGYNVGTMQHFKDLSLSFSTGLAISEKISSYAEYFSTIRKGYDEHNVDLGILYVPHPKIQLDIAAGRSLQKDEKRLFTTMGISYAF